MVDIIRVIILLVIITCNGIVTATSQCLYKGIFDGNKVTINLSTIIDSFPIIVQDTNTKFTYKIDLCNSINCNKDLTSECGCQLGAHKDNKPYQFSLGHLSTAKWTIKSLSPPEFVVKYTNGDISPNIHGTEFARSAVFNFKYSDATTSDTTKITKDDDVSLQYTFAITGGHVSISNGGKPSGSGGGTAVGYIGLVIIILILVAIIIYLIVGCVYMYMLRGARGVEVVPHLNYWTEVPLLVKDGCVFTFGSLVRKVRGGQSYERI